MRALTLAFALSVLAATVVGCGDDSGSESSSSEPTLIPPGSSTGGTSASTTTGSNVTPGGSNDAPAVDAELDEVVYVIADWHGGTAFCNGTLVASDIVVTAGHCLDENEMSNWHVIAPRAAGKPDVYASRVERYQGDYDDPAVADLGVIHLSEPIALAAYAKITDVSARVDKGEALEAMAVVRTAEEVDAPFKSSAIMKLSSAVDLGYEHGYTTSMFTIGGDSGSGLFLVRNGKRTHELIGVARQPEPNRGLDHFTRIDPETSKWYGGTAD